MSIFTKITFLFSISLALMIGIAYQIDKINTEKYESLVLQKYAGDARKIFTWMATSSADELQDKLRSLNLRSVPPVTAKRMITSRLHTFGIFEIFESERGDYVMHIRYIDDELFLHDTALSKIQNEGWMLNLLVIADIAVLAVIFIIILRMLAPLRSIASGMRRFAAGEYHSRCDTDSADEIGEVAHTYNEMAQTIENLILSRQELLRDVGHELRTPIARGLFALEQIEPSPARETLKHSFHELDQLTQELLEIEKIRSDDTLQSESFSAETLAMEALSKLHLTDESSVWIDIRKNFFLTGDLQYLSLALKNLLDNALKYSDRLPITLEIDSNRISVLNHGKPLERDYTHFLTPFTRQESSRSSQGFGLGLNIVSKIIEKHRFKLTYDYTDGMHRFSIITA